MIQSPLCMKKHSALRENLVMGKSVLMPKLLENRFKADSCRNIQRIPMYWITERRLTVLTCENNFNVLIHVYRRKLILWRNFFPLIISSDSSSICSIISIRKYTFRMRVLLTEKETRNNLSQTLSQSISIRFKYICIAHSWG